MGVWMMMQRICTHIQDYSSNPFIKSILGCNLETPQNLGLKELMNDGAMFTVCLDDIENEPQEKEDKSDITEAMLKFDNLECLGLADEETYTEGEPFESIATKMFNLLGNGKVKKRIIRNGYGEKPVDLAVVRVDYNAYIEYDSQPFDSTYARKKCHQFRVNNGEVLPGLDMAVQSMQLNEKSQFLVHSDYAYGELGCLGRVPGKATILFEIELLEIVDSSAVTKYEQLTEEKKKDFSEIYKYCLSLSIKGKDLISTAKNYKAAIHEYNTAVYKLENAQLNDYSDQEKQQTLLLKLLSNLLVCYTILEEPRKGCRNANKIYEMCRGTNLKISAKVFFNNAKCLRMLGDYQQAEKRLKQARNIEPRNPDIAEEFILLHDAKEKQKKNDQMLAKALVGSK